MISLYHVAPLARLPSILNDGALYSKSVLAARRICGRPSARRRDYALGLGDYVHLSPFLITPLVRDKATKGYSHVVLEFNGERIISQAGSAIVKYNTKSWFSKDTFRPERDLDTMRDLLRICRSGARFQSMEVLAQVAVSLKSLVRIHCLADEWVGEVQLLTSVFGYQKVSVECVTRGVFMNTDENSEKLRAYLQSCSETASCLNVLDLPFD